MPKDLKLAFFSAAVTFAGLSPSGAFGYRAVVGIAAHSCLLWGAQFGARFAGPSMMGASSSLFATWEPQADVAKNHSTFRCSWPVGTRRSQVKSSIRSIAMLKLERIEGSDEQLERPAEKSRENRSATVREAVELRADRHELPSLAPVNSSATYSRLRPSRNQWARWALFALLPIAAVAGAYWYVTGGQIMSTDDAYVEADKVGISTDVSGIVQDVDVRDNQHVTAGQILYRLDPRQFQIALDNANANLAQTALTIDAMKQDYKRMLSDICGRAGAGRSRPGHLQSPRQLLPSDTVSQASSIRRTTPCSTTRASLSR